MSVVYYDSMVLYQDLVYLILRYLPVISYPEIDISPSFWVMMRGITGIMHIELRSVRIELCITCQIYIFDILEMV